MGELVKNQKGGLISLLHGKGGEIALSKPFEREIDLFDTYVAGTQFIQGIFELEPNLKEGDKLDFFREPENPHDANAIVIKTTGGVKIGYVPKRDNPVFSRLMDAGKLLFGRIVSKSMSKDTAVQWLEIEIKIFLKD
jgi:hypothetical protein